MALLYYFGIPETANSHFQSQQPRVSPSENLMSRFMEMLETGEGSMDRVYKVGAPSQGANSTLRGRRGRKRPRALRVECDIIGPELWP